MSISRWARRTIAVAALFCSSCASQGEEDDKRGECTRMRDHIVELRLGEYSNIKDASGKKIDVSGHRDAMLSVLGDSFVAECVDKMTLTELRCARGAAAISALTACSTPQVGDK